MLRRLVVYERPLHVSSVSSHSDDELSNSVLPRITHPGSQTGAPNLWDERHLEVGLLRESRP